MNNYTSMKVTSRSKGGTKQYKDEADFDKGVYLHKLYSYIKGWSILTKDDVLFLFRKYIFITKLKL